MANKKISQLTSLTSASIASDDLFPIVDVSATSTPTGETKKLSVEDLHNYILNTGGILSGTSSYATYAEEAGTAVNVESVLVGQVLNSINIGVLNPSSPGAFAIQIGNSTAANYSISMGRNANTGIKSVAIGQYAVAAISTATGGGVAIGYSATGDEKGVSIGELSDSGISSVSIGYNSNSGYKSVAIGKDSNASGVHAVSIGEGARSTANGGISMGRDSLSSSSGSICIGESSFTSGRSISVGALSRAAGDSALSIGRESSAGTNALSIGSLSSATANGVSLGTYSSAYGVNSLAIGTRVESNENYVGEIGIWSTGGRSSGVRLSGPSSMVNLSIGNRSTKYDDGGATAGDEADDSIMRESYAIRRNGDDVYIDVNIGGTVKTAMLTTVS